MIRLATPADAPAVHAIYAPIVRDSAISFEWEVPSVAEMAARMSKVLATRPWLVYDVDSEILGYVYASTFRERFAYRWGTEVSVYMREDARDRGLAKVLYRCLFDLLRLQGYCTAIAGATVPNAASERLHESLGFELVGRFPGIGFKMGAWHDVAFYQLSLQPLPRVPHEIRSLSDVAGTAEFNDALEKQTQRT